MNSINITNKIIPSNEQVNIITHANLGYNIVVNSVFGSGKTTTILEIAKKLSSKYILNLTYNSRLKINTREKCKLLGITNMITHSYHALAVKYYSNIGNTDNGIINILSKNIKFKKPYNHNNFDIIILDEQQDMTPLYNKLIFKFLLDLGKNDLQFIIFGDIYQNIYEYKGSDSRYLTLADKIYSHFTDKKWIELKISTSYRTTNQISSFINKHLLGYNRIKTIKEGVPVKYLLVDSFSDTVYLQILDYLKLGFLTDDFFILAPSLRCGAQKSPIRLLENRLVKNGIPCFVPINDSETLSDNIINNKIVFSTFHQVKGLERKIVIVYNFDNSYFKYYAKNHPQSVLPNPIYVAVSRALTTLVLVHHYENEYFPTLKKNSLILDSDFKKYKHLLINNNISQTKKITKGVVDIIRHLDYKVYEDISKLYCIKLLQRKETIINLPLEIKTNNNLLESVSYLNGLAIPMIYETTLHNNTSSILTYLKSNYIKISNFHKKKLNIVINSKLISISQSLYCANLYNSLITGYTCHLEQIYNYNWISKEHIDITNSRLAKYISNKAIFEIPLTGTLSNLYINGQIDILENNTLWEIKCVKQLEHSHHLQGILYIWIYYQNFDKLLPVNIFNILTNEIIQIKIDTLNNLENIIQYVVHQRFIKQEIDISDSVFITHNSKYKDFKINNINKKPNCQIIDSDSESESEL